MNDIQNSKIFDFKIYTPAEILVSGKVKSVMIPSIAGPFQVLYNHAPVIAAMSNGTIIVVAENDKEWHYLIKGGIAELHKNQVSIMVEDIEKI